MVKKSRLSLLAYIQDMFNISVETSESVSLVQLWIELIQT